jgi:hypothetical protein
VPAEVPPFEASSGESSSPVAASPAVQDLASSVDKVVRDEGLVLDPRRQMADLEVLARARIGLDYSMIRALRSAEASGALAQIAGRPVKSWLVEECRMPKAMAGRFRYLVRFLEQFPQVDEAFAQGRVSMEHAAAVIRALLTLPPELRDTVEPFLLEACDDMTPDEVTRWVDELLEGMGFDKESDERRERRLAQRGVDFNAVAHRTYAMSGTLMPDVAEALKLALQTADSPGGDEDDRTPRQRAHDALGVIARFFLDHADLSPVNGERPRLVITIRREDLDAAPGVAALASLASGDKIPVETARRLCCDAGVLPVVLSGKGEVLDLGRASRTFSTATRRAALIQQHGKCAFPKCKRPVMECHHIEWWSRGGASDLGNAAWLCAFHHWLVHEGKWEMRRADDGFSFTSPYGDTRHRCLGAA